MMINDRLFVLCPGDIVVVSQPTEPLWDSATRRHRPGPLQDITVRVLRVLERETQAHQRMVLAETALGNRLQMHLPEWATRVAMPAEVRAWRTERAQKRAAVRTARWTRRAMRGLAWRTGERTTRVEVAIAASRNAGESRFKIPWPFEADRVR